MEEIGEKIIDASNLGFYRGSCGEKKFPFRLFLAPPIINGRHPRSVTRETVMWLLLRSSKGFIFIPETLGLNEFEERNPRQKLSVFGSCILNYHAHVILCYSLYNNF